MLKAVFFDAAGTLIHLPRPVGEHYRDVAARFGAHLDAAQLDRAFRSAWTRAPARINDHRPRSDDDKGWWRALVGSVLAQTLTPSQATSFDVENYFEALYAHFAEPGVWAAYPEVADILDQLRSRGFTLGLISNFDRRLYAVLDHLGLRTFFSAIIISSEVGADKPDPYIFQRALAAVGVGPAKALHVGDDPEKDWGAEAAGLPVFRLERPSVTLRDLLAVINRPTPSR